MRRAIELEFGVDMVSVGLDVPTMSALEFAIIVEVDVDDVDEIGLDDIYIRCYRAKYLYDLMAHGLCQRLNRIGRDNDHIKLACISALEQEAEDYDNEFGVYRHDERQSENDLDRF